MYETYKYDDVLNFAYQQNKVAAEINARENAGYFPVGVNMRRKYSPKHERFFMVILIDFAKENEPPNVIEDMVIWITWDKEKLIFWDWKPAYEIPDL